MKIIFGFLLLIIFLAGCTQYQQPYTQPVSQPEIQGNQTQQPPNDTTQQPSSEGALQGQVSQPQQPSTKEFSFEADDNGYYTNGQKVSSISVNKEDTVKITFSVRKTNVYSGGLEMRGCSQTTGGIPPEKQGSLEFIASSSCTITGYWPSTNIAKSSLQVTVS